MLVFGPSVRVFWNLTLVSSGESKVNNGGASVFFAVSGFVGLQCQKKSRISVEKTAGIIVRMNSREFTGGLSTMSML
jgi:hypothetical protein